MMASIIDTMLPRAAVVYQSVSNSQEIKFRTFWKITHTRCKKKVDFADWIVTTSNAPLAISPVEISSVDFDTSVKSVGLIFVFRCHSTAIVQVLSKVEAIHPLRRHLRVESDALDC